MRIGILPLAVVFMGSTLAQAATNSLTELSKKEAMQMESFYQELHRTPELSGQEKETAKRMAAQMRGMGLEVIEGIGGTGVVGILRNGDGPTTWVRSELDGLPVEEMTGAKYKSENPGKMHACGHDFHMTSMLGAARVMMATKADWKGTLVFVAQPAEEIVKGAKAMIADSAFKKLPKPARLIALHTTSNYKKGVIGITSGFTTANSDTVEVVFKGKGAHGSRPEKGIDPFVMAAEYTLKMQTLLGREKQASKPAVISIGSIHGGTKANIIPDDVKLQLTVRTYDPEVRTYVLKRMAEIAKGIAKTNNAPEPEVTVPEGTDAMFNDLKLAEQTRTLLTARLGKNAVVESEPVMGGEDFGQFAQAFKAPSVFIWVGQQMDDESTTNHSPRFLPHYAKTAPLAVQTLAESLSEWHKK